MKKIYVIKKLDSDGFSEDIWNSLQKVDISCYPWDENGYKPKTEAAVFYNDKGLYVRFKVFENKVSVSCFDLNGPVCNDSCVEFFINPAPSQGPAYMNFEVNAAGILLLHIRKSKNDLKPVQPEEVPQFEIRTSIGKGSLESYNGPYYTVEYHIPFEFISKYFEGIKFGPGTTFEANFYKCGGKTPHFGCWNLVETEVPSYHHPEFFGTLVLE